SCWWSRSWSSRRSRCSCRTSSSAPSEHPAYPPHGGADARTPRDRRPLRHAVPAPGSVLMPRRTHHPHLVVLTGLDHHELAHHPLVLVQQHVAVVHVRQVRIG